MAKLLGPDFIALQVRDLERSTRFYVEQLGLTPAKHRPPGAVIFDTAPVPFALREPLVDLDATDRLAGALATTPMLCMEHSLEQASPLPLPLRTVLLAASSPSETRMVIF